MNKGLVIGKFYPPHLGHSFLIDYAIKNSDEVYVLVCDDKKQKIPAVKRAGWLQEIHKNTKVKIILDIGKDDDSKAWADHVKEFLGFAPDTVFSSENYGITFAKELGCKHVMVDNERKNINISATKIRNDLINNLEYLHPVTRKDFVSRIVILGAESTGTTTLAKELAQHYKTNVVQEYGRYYSESVADVFNYVWTDSDFSHIASVQNQMEDKLATTANKVLICDTDSYTTSIWQKRYMGGITKEVEELSLNRNYDLYILTGEEIPFVQDGVRDGENIRHKMHNWFEDKLKKDNKNFILVRGSREERLEQAKKEIDKILAKKQF